MDAFNAIVKVPSWAYDFCYYYLAAAAVVVVYSVYSIVNVLLLPASVKKVMPVTSVVFALFLSGVVTSILVMMQFWICRSALRPVEKFASNCSSVGDCVASAGAPQGSMWTCGERGLCGRCKSRAVFCSPSGPNGVAFLIHNQ